MGEEAPSPELVVADLGTIGPLLPVGSRSLGAGRWGHQDLHGNLFEALLDVTDPMLISLPVPCGDCAELRPDWEIARVARGASFVSPIALGSPSEYVFAVLHAQRHVYVGVRCASDL